MLRILFMSFLACLSLPIVAQGQSGCSDVKSAQGALVGPFRVFNTAEMQYFRQNHRYADVNELFASEGLKKMASTAYAHPVTNSAPIGTSADPVPGYDVRLTVPSDGKSYTILATKKEAPCQLAGAVTDNRGMIYVVEALQ